MRTDIMERQLGVSVSDDLEFSLCGNAVDYRFRVDTESGDLHLLHFGAPGQGPGGPPRREFPDSGRGDYQLPAIHIRHADGDTVSEFKYASHKIVKGKPGLPGLPATFGSKEEAHTILVTLKDDYSDLEAELSYSIFPKYNAIARSFSLRNCSSEAVTIERAVSACVELPRTNEPWDMLQLGGDWGRECQRTRRPIDFGNQGFHTTSGYSSHEHNPFVSVAPHSTTEHSGEAYGFSFIYSGSFAIDIEKYQPGKTRILVGLNPLHLSWKLGPGETFQSPECCIVYESVKGFGGMSRSLHGLYRNHLSRSKWTLRPRPILANNWEATEFDFDEERLYGIAKSAADLGVSLYVMDDGWFGVKHPRENDHAGLGDWQPNPKRFPKGLDGFIERINKIKPLNRKKELEFGIWVEPEMVNPQSELYEAHPDWALHAGRHKRTEGRNQLVLNLALREVQEHVIKSVCDLLEKYNIVYVKWDKNRDISEMPSPSTAHAYMLGLYRCYDTIISRFPDILFEGCAGGGGRFDPGVYHYFPQSWASDNTDAVERLHIQFGVTVAYPASTMGCHVSAVPSLVGRTTPIKFRAHVAMMGGSFGLELDPAALTKEEQDQIPSLIDLAERVNPYVIQGDQYRLAIPEESNWPAVQYLMDDGSAVVLAYQIHGHNNTLLPTLILQDLEGGQEYKVKMEGGESTVASGATLMHSGLRWEPPSGDYQSQVVWVMPVEKD